MLVRMLRKAMVGCSMLLVQRDLIRVESGSESDMAKLEPAWRGP